MTTTTIDVPVLAPTKLTAAQILRHAAALIEERGHSKGAFRRRNGKVCAIGACRMAAFGNTRHRGATLAAFEYWQALQALSGSVAGRTEGLANIPAWNDDPRRDAHEVTSTMRQVADAIELA